MKVLLICAALFLPTSAISFVVLLRHYIYKLINSNDVSNSIAQSLKDVVSSFSEHPSRASLLEPPEQFLEDTWGLPDRGLEN